MRVPRFLRVRPDLLRLHHRAAASWVGVLTRHQRFSIVTVAHVGDADLVRDPGRGPVPGIPLGRLGVVDRSQEQVRRQQHQFRDQEQGMKAQRRRTGSGDTGLARPGRRNRRWMLAIMIVWRKTIQSGM